MECVVVDVCEYTSRVTLLLTILEETLAFTLSVGPHRLSRDMPLSAGRAITVWAPCPLYHLPKMLIDRLGFP